MPLRLNEFKTLWSLIKYHVEFSGEKNCFIPKKKEEKQQNNKSIYTAKRVCNRIWKYASRRSLRCAGKHSIPGITFVISLKPDGSI